MANDMTVGANSSVGNSALQGLSEAELFGRTERLADRERTAAVDLIMHVAEIDRRRAALKRGYSSTFDYCVRRLRYAEGASYRIIRAARAIRLMPGIELRLRQGALSLESVALLHAHLEDPDAARLVLQCENKSTRAIEALLAKRRTASVSRDVVRLVGIAPCDSPSPAPAPTSVPLVLSSEATPEPSTPRLLVRICFTADDGLLARLRRAQEVLRHKYPDGRLEGVLGAALDAVLDKKDMDRILARRDAAKAAKANRERRPPRSASAGGSGGAPRLERAA